MSPLSRTSPEGDTPNLFLQGTNPASFTPWFSEAWSTLHTPLLHLGTKTRLSGSGFIPRNMCLKEELQGTSREKYGHA